MVLGVVGAEWAQLTTPLPVFQEILRGTGHGQGDSSDGTNQLVHQPFGSEPSCAAERWGWGMGHREDPLTLRAELLFEGSHSRHTQWTINAHPSVGSEEKWGRSGPQSYQPPLRHPKDPTASHSCIHPFTTHLLIPITFPEHVFENLCSFFPQVNGDWSNEVTSPAFFFCLVGEGVGSKSSED